MQATYLWAALPVDASVGLSGEQKWNMIRNYRNELLGKSDWTQLPDVPLTLEEKQSWATYRQALRDITEDYTAPDEVMFPTPPGDGR